MLCKADNAKTVKRRFEPIVSVKFYLIRLRFAAVIEKMSPFVGKV